jgi:hypothetical protein
MKKKLQPSTVMKMDLPSNVQKKERKYAKNLLRNAANAPITERNSKLEKII